MAKEIAKYIVTFCCAQCWSMLTRWHHALAADWMAVDSGGGVANIYDSTFQFIPPQKMTFSSFELLVIKSMQSTQSLFIAIVYRTPGPYTAFLTEIP